MTQSRRARAAFALILFLATSWASRLAAAQEGTDSTSTLSEEVLSEDRASENEPPPAPAPPIDLTFSPANPEALEAMRDAGHLRNDTPSAGVSAYLATMVRRAQLWAYRALISGLSRITNLRSLLKLAGQVLVWAAILAVLLGAAAFLSRLFNRRRKSTLSSTTLTTQAGTAPTQGAAVWRAEVESRLGAGDVPGALEALWWWLARSLAADRVDPTWTSRELLRHAPIERSQRRLLLPAVRQLDVFTYGPNPAEIGHVRGFVGDLDTVLKAFHHAPVTESSAPSSVEASP